MVIDVVDFSDLQRRGLLPKKSIPQKQTLTTPTNGILDLSTMPSAASVSTQTPSMPSLPTLEPRAFPTPHSASTENAFDLLGSLAQAASSPNSASVYGAPAVSSFVGESTIHTTLEKLSSALERIEARLERLESGLSYRSY